MVSGRRVHVPPIVLGSRLGVVSMISPMGWAAVNMVRVLVRCSRFVTARARPWRVTYVSAMAGVP